MVQKEGEGLLCPFVGELGPRLTQCDLGRGLLPYQVASSPIQPFGHNRHGPKLGGGCALFSGGAGSPSNTKSPGPRPTSIPSGVLVHPAVCPQRTLAENCEEGGCAPLGEGELGPHLTQCRLGWAYLRTKWYPDQYSHLATIDMGQKLGGCAPRKGTALSWEKLGPHVTQCRLGPALPPYQVASRSIQPFGHNRHGSKIGGSAPFLRRGWVRI